MLVLEASRDLYPKIFFSFHAISQLISFASTPISLMEVLEFETCSYNIIFNSCNFPTNFLQVSSDIPNSGSSVKIIS